MKRFYKFLMSLAAIVAMTVPWSARAQSLSDYELDVDTTTFTSIVSTGTAMTFTSADDGYGTCTLPFAFPFGEDVLASGSSIACSANGFIRLGAASTSGTSGVYTGTYKEINVILKQDGHLGRHTGSGAYYYYDATAGTFTIEYHLLGSYSSPYDAYSYQVILHNDGQIEIVFDTVGLAATSRTLATYLVNSADDALFLNGPWAAPVMALAYATRPCTDLPVHGLRYTLTRPYVSCPKPTSIMYVCDDVDEMTVYWTHGGTETAWEVSLGDDIQYVTDTFYTFTNLNSNTLYHPAVRAICGAGDTSGYREGHFRTPCAAISSLPYSNDFEDEPYYLSGTTSYADAFPNCWTRINDATGTYNYYPYVTTSSSYVHSGTNGLYWYHTTSSTYASNQYAVLPPVDLSVYDISDLTLSFFAKTTSTSYHPQPIIGVMSNPGDTSTFVPVHTFTATDITTAWQMFDVSFANYTGTGNYIAIKWPRTSSTCYLGIDDIFLTDEWCDVPQDVVAHSTLDEVTVSWNSNGGSSFTVYLGEDTVAGVTDTFYTFTGLDANTEYAYGVATECSSTSSMFINNTVRTRCDLLDSLPYVMDFEGYPTSTSSSETFVPCLTRLNNGTQYFGYPYLSSTASYCHSGSRGLYWYNNTTIGTYGDYQVVVMPGIDTNLYEMNTLQMKFWARATGTSYNPTFQVGVMTDPDDINTFQLVGTVNVGPNTTYTEYVVPLADFEGYGQYIALRANRPTTSWYATVDDISIETIPTCPPVVDLTVAGTTAGGALLTWDYQNGAPSEPEEYSIEVIDLTTSNSSTYTTADNFYAITGLDAETQYKVFVSTDCGSNGIGGADSVEFSTSGLPCLAVDPTQSFSDTIGNGTSTSSYIPSYSTYNYGFSQQIYTAAEIGAGGSITSISVMPSAISQQRTYEIYMAHTSNSTLSGFIHPSDMVKVYNGAAVTLTANQWVTFTLDQPFLYNGSDNLLVCFRDMTGAWVSGNTWYVHSISGNSVYVYQDGGAYDPFTVSGGTTTANRNNIIINASVCAQAATCANPLLTAVSVDSADVELAWVAGYLETSWNLEYRVAGGSWQTLMADITGNTYTVTDLTPATDYEFRLSHACDGVTYSSSVSVHTPCVSMSIPYVENFDDLTSGTATSNLTVMPNCWNYTLTGTSTYQASSYWPGVYYSTSYSTSGNYCLRLYGVGVFELPQVNVPLDSLMVSFNDYTTSSSYILEVGVIENGSFVPVATPSLSASTHNLVEVSFANYHGNSRTIALRNSYGTYGYSYHYIDDLMIDYIPTCPHVTNLHSTSVTNDSVYLQWTPGGSESAWIVSDGINETVVNTNTFAFGDLLPSTAYTFTVRPVCSDEDTGSAMSVTARTLCTPVMTLPFFDDFDSYTTSTTAATGVTPGCWNYTMTNSSYSSSSYVPQVYYTSTAYYHHSGRYSLRLYGVGYTVMPALPIAADSVSMGFWAMHTSSNYELYVGVMDHPDSLSSFDTIMRVPYTTTSAQQYFEVNFSNYTGTGRYIAFLNNYTGYGYSYNYLDDISIWRNSSCPTPSYVQVSNVSNDQATVYWGDTTNGQYNNVSVIWSTINNINQALDSAVVTGATDYTIPNLTGNTTYYVWVRGNCSEEPSRVLNTSFTTTPDCLPVENLTVAGIDYNAFGLDWTAPTVAHPATAYIVSWKEASASTWTSDTTTNLYYYVSGLNLATSYQYRVTTICNTEVSATNSGTVSTRSCGQLVTDGGTTYNYLPTQQFYNYSYTQQLYLASELVGIDSIAHIAFQVADGYEASQRNVTLYLGNTSKSLFANTSDYVAASALTQVYTGTIGGTGWIDIALSNVFVRNADSNLVVVVDDNTGSYTSTISWVATSTATQRALYYYHDNGDITPAAPSANNQGAVNYVNQISIAGPSCATPDCATPIIFVSNVSTNQIDITWNAETGSTYEVAYTLAGDNNWTVSDATNTTGISSITGLTPSADWTIRVRVDCNGDTLVATRMVSTACGAAALPLTEDFQMQEYGNFSRSCWTVGTTNLGTTYPYPRVTSLQGATENKLCLFYNGGYLILPKVDAPLDELQIRFKLTQGGDNVRFLMGLIENPTMPISAMTVLDTLIRSRIDTTMATVNITYSFENIDPADTGKYICFWDAFNDNYSFLDDIVVEYVPQCTPVTGLTVTNVTATSAEVSWTDNGANATGYIVEIGPRYFTPGDTTVNQIFTTTGTSIILNGLTHSTSYDVYVYTECTSIGAISIASQVLMFQTACDAITELPYFTDFENIMSPGSSATDVMPNCWTSESLVGTMPHIYYTTTGGYTSSPTHCLYFYSEGVAVLPQFGVPLDTLMVSFYDYNSTTAAYGLVIGTVDSLTPGFSASFTGIDTIVFENGIGNGYNVVSYLTDYAGTSPYIAIKNFNTVSTSTYAYHYIDDLTVDYVPSCIAPQHVRTTLLLDNQADLVWNVSQAAGYNVEYGLHGFTPGTGTVLTTTTRSISITGLTAQTQYDVYLVSNCGSDTTFYTFTTTCTPVTLPYSENFDSHTTSTTASTGVHINCWDYIMTGTSSYQGSSYQPQIYYSPTYANSGSYSYRLYGVCYLKLPPMPTSLDSLTLTFSDYTTSTYYGLEVGVMEGNTFIPVQTISSPTSTHVEYEILFNSYTGNSRTIAFRNFYTTSASTSYSYHYIDDIFVDYTPSCPKVVDVTSAGVSTTSLDLDWTDRVTAPQWEIEYGPAGYTMGSTSGTRLVVNSHPATVTGLAALTTYDFYVRPICSATDTGYWSNKATLITGMCDNSVEAFTGAATSTTYFAPVNNYYRYTLSETIIDSAELVGIGDIQTIAYSYHYATPSTDKTDVTIWLQHTTKSTFSGSTDVITLDTNVAVKVYEGELNCIQGWNYFTFDSVSFTWDGHSNIVVIVDDNSYDYNGLSYTFDASACTGTKTLHYYSDSQNPDPLNPTAFTGSKSTLTNMRPTMKLISCGAACAEPAQLNASNITYNSATINWTGSADTYEISVKAATASTWPDPVTVNTNSYSVSELTPETDYQFMIRAICDTTEGLISNWVNGTFTTDELPCFVPTELHTTSTNYTNATLAWNAGGAETEWNLHVWNSTFDTVIAASATTLTVTGLAQTTQYNAAVKAVCGGGYAESEYGDTIQFTTTTCPQVEGVTVSDVTANSATVTWMPASGASSYILEYGNAGFQQGQGTPVTVSNAITYTLTGLESEKSYSVFVRAVCAEDATGAWSSRVNFVTLEGGQTGINGADGANLSIYPNPTTSSTTIALSGVSGSVSVNIVDMNGRVVMSDTMSCEGDCAKTMEVSGLAQGAYFVRISGENVNMVKKLVVK